MIRNRIAIIWLLVVICSILIIPVVRPRELPDVINDVYPSVVYIEADGYYGKWSGSGVVVHERGLILTAKHILEDADYIRVTFPNGNVYDGVNWLVDPNDDVGILQIATLEDLPMSSFDTTNCRVGEEVFIIGSPFGLFNSVNKGIISAVDREVCFFGIEPMLQADIAGNPGNSGCPVFNMDGDVIGIIVGGIIGGDGIGFVTSADVCKKLVDKYVEEYPKNIYKEGFETAGTQERW